MRAAIPSLLSRTSSAVVKNDKLTGDSGDNVIEGLAGADTLDGGAHTQGEGDTLSYQSSPGAVQVDLNQGDLAADGTTRLIKESAGGHAQGDKVTYNTFEKIIGSRHGDTLTGDNRANTLTGGAGSDTLDGDDGNDMLFGGPGNDKLYGGDEDDTLTGGAGADRLDGEDNNAYREGYRLLRRGACRRDPGPGCRPGPGRRRQRRYIFQY